MGTFYGGIAHVPLSSLVLVCELAGSYDLLVPLMLAEGIAFVVLRRRSLYRAQLATQRDSPAAPAQERRHSPHDPGGFGDAHGLGQRLYPHRGLGTQRPLRR